MDYSKIFGANGGSADDVAIGLLEEADMAERYAKAIRLALLAGYPGQFLVDRVYGNVSSTDANECPREMLDVMREVAERLESGVQSRFTGY